MDSVTAVLVTRGNVDIWPVLDSLPDEWQVVIWDNGGRCLRIKDANNDMLIRGETITDVSVYGRYAAIEHASNDLIYVQDDDVIVSDPQAIVDRFNSEFCGGDLTWDGVACNMPQEFRPH